MFNPLVTGIKDLSDDELIAKVNDLNTKMRQASQAGMFGAINQMVVVLDEYQEEVNRRHRKSMEEGAEKFDELIDVNKNQ
jgi:hypothetical protein